MVAMQKIRLCRLIEEAYTRIPFWMALRLLRAPSLRLTLASGAMRAGMRKTATRKVAARVM